MHKLLKRQLIKTGVSDEFVQKNQALLEAISEVYQRYDMDINLLEHAIDVTGAELTEKYQELKVRYAQQQSLQVELSNSLEIFNATLESTGEGFMVLDQEGRLIAHNKLALQLLGLEAIDVKNSKGKELFEKTRSNFVDFSSIENDLRQVAKNSESYLSGFVEHKNGTVLEYHSLPFRHENEIKGRVWSFRDITQVKQQEALIHNQAYYDQLTGLPNRLLYIDRLRHAVDYAKRKERKISVVLIDLDDFKKINDTRGHQVGDEVLKRVARRIKKILRDYDTLARIGGDEFVILLEDIDDVQLPGRMAERLLRLMERPFDIDEDRFFLSPSIGITVFPDDGEEISRLMRNADIAMYKAKEKGKSTFQFFDVSMEEQAFAQVDMERKLRTAIERKEFELHLQPIIDLQTHSIHSAEALIRWKPDGQNYLPPFEFIPIAEQSGLIVPIGEQVLEKAIEILASWRNQGVEDFSLSVNLSMRQFINNPLSEKILAVLEHHNFPPPTLKVEVTESMLMENMQLVCGTLEKLRAEKVGISIDDFGTGYSSLSYLRTLPIDTLKIDRAFIKDLLTSPKDRAIASSIITLAHNLNLQVVAEGIEELESAEWLKSQGCHLAQGFYFYKPMPAGDLLALLKKERHL